MEANDLQAEKIRFLYAGGTPALAVTLSIAAIMIAVYWRMVPTAWMAGWMLAVGLGYGLRAALLVAYRRRSKIAPLKSRWLIRFRWSVLLAGLVWGFGGVLLTQVEDFQYQVFASFVLAAISAGAITSLAMDRTATMAFVIPVLVPIASRFVLDGTYLSLMMGLSVMVFLLFLAVTARRIETYLHESARLRLRAETQRRQIQLNELRWNFAVEASALGLWDWDIQHRKTYYSPHWKAMLGHGDDEVTSSESERSGRVHPDDSRAVSEALSRHLAGEAPVNEVEYRLRCSDDSYKWFLGRGQVVEWTADGQPKRMIGVDIDITDRKAADLELRIAAAVFESQEGIVVTDGDETILRVNNAFMRMTGYSADEVVGQTPRVLRSGRHDLSFYKEMWAAVERTGAWQGEVWNRRKTGEIYPEWLNITALKDADGKVTHYVGTLHDITERKAAEVAIQHLAFYDALTGLPNRRLLLDRLQHALIVSERALRYGALLFIDLDRFKELNDTLGHPIGDLMLQSVGRRLRESVRDVDTVSRLGGDEFVVMLEDLSPEQRDAELQAADVAAKLQARLAEPYFLDGHRHDSTPSIGVTLFFGQRVTTDELLSRADIAMYGAKQAGRNTVRFFDPAMQASVEARSALKEDLRQGIREKEFELRFQPQFDSAGAVTGAEVLVRWENREGEPLHANDFIPLAEESGLILPLGYWVLEAACGHLRAWSDNPALAHLTLAVNVSDRQCRDSSFVRQVQGILDRTGANPDRLVLEVSEGLLMRERERATAMMLALHARGVRFALDNFGAAYSSLADLKSVPLSQLKLDQSFVRDVLSDPKAAAIVCSVIGLGEDLGLDVVAAGVEDRAQHRFLAENACQAFQGYLFGKPLTAAALEESLGRKAAG